MSGLNEDASAQEVEAHTPVHLTLQQYEPVHVALDLPRGLHGEHVAASTAA
jgi:hypothetical protein